jgi:hypothetical protein
MVRVIIAGSRSFNNYEFLESRVREVFRDLTLKGYLTGIPRNDILNIEIISGKANGADTLGERFADKYGIAIKPFPADWNDFSEPCVVKYNKFGKPYNALSGNNRNKAMADYAFSGNPGVLIAFWDGKSPGTKNMIDLAKTRDLLVYTFNF